ncbi:endonuclease YhcR precursor [mine drainage metagenome]|uniref:Endonuclease YhcR n=1 Tax=mine drainage metagenome TaxID=410659 RepID=A0A1J5SCC2_9ZZZZ
MKTKLQVSKGALGVLLLAASSSVWAQNSVLDGHVVGVTDGDTITVLDALNKTHEIRLAWIDAPETSCHMRRPSRFDEECVEHSQNFGKAAKRNLSGMVYDQDVRIHVLEGSTYGGEIGVVFLGATDVNYQQVVSGYAWHYQKYAVMTQTPAQFDLYRNAEQDAKQGGLGLWADKEPLAPWDFRAINRKAGVDYRFPH